MKTLFNLIAEVAGFMSALVVLIVAGIVLALSLLTRRVSEWLLSVAQALYKLMGKLTGYEKKETNVEIETN